MPSKTTKKNSKMPLIIGGVIVLLVIVGIIALIFSTRGPSYTQESIDTFAQCLTENGATMYGAYWCSHCKATKAKFGDSFQYINYVECTSDCIPDENGNVPSFCQGYEGQPELCLQLDILGYDTWIFSDDSRVEGEPSFSTLAEKTGCEGILVEQ